MDIATYIAAASVALGIGAVIVGWCAANIDKLKSQVATIQEWIRNQEKEK